MAKRFFRVVKPFDRIHAQKMNLIGEFIGIIDECIGLNFLDGTEYYFYPDEVKELSKAGGEYAIC